MKNVAILDENNVVVNVIVVDDDSPVGTVFSDDNPALIGGDLVEGFFYAPQPYASWTRVEGEWIPPKPMPKAEGFWDWNEETQEWEA